MINLELKYKETVDKNLKNFVKIEAEEELREIREQIGRIEQLAMNLKQEDKNIEEDAKETELLNMVSVLLSSFSTICSVIIIFAR